MIISYRKKFLFVHTPKTGGTAVVNKLLPYARLRDRLAHEREQTFFIRAVFPQTYRSNNRIELFSGLKPHANLEDGERLFGRDKLEPLFKFGFVRNPYTRTYSLYKFITRNPKHPLNEPMRDKGFDWFVEFICKNQWMKQQDRFHWRGQTQIALDHVGCHERFDEECRLLSDKLKIEALAAPKKINAGEHEPVDYAQLFKNASEPFLNWYGADFEIFNYSRDPKCALEPPKPYSRTTGSTNAV